MTRWLKERVVVTLLLSGLLMVVAGLGLERKYMGVPRDRYLDMKYHWRACADCVVAGDSRVLVGMSPAAMATELPGRRILNYAYPGAAYTREYLDHVARVVDPVATRKTIILGLSPRALTVFATREAVNGFVQREKQLPTEARLCFADVLWLVRPLPMERLRLGFVGKLPTGQRWFHADGWTAARMTPEDPRRTMREYTGLFAEGPVRDDMLADVLEYVRRWTDTGVRVYGFRPPAAPDIISIEDAQSGFQALNVAVRFEDAGGIWIDTNLVGYRSIDGSHLHVDAARQFSRDLAAAIRAFEERAPAVVAVKPVRL